MVPHFSEMTSYEMMAPCSLTSQVTIKTDQPNRIREMSHTTYMWGRTSPRVSRQVESVAGRQQRGNEKFSARQARVESQVTWRLTPHDRPVSTNQLWLPNVVCCCQPHYSTMRA